MTDIDKQALREAAREEVMRREVCDTSDEWTDEATPEAVLALLDELEAADALNKHLELAIRKAEGCSEKLRAGVEASEKRIAELEARTSTVKLRKYSVSEVMLITGFDRQYAEGWCAGNDNAIHEVRAAGIALDAGE
jgi:uncharacterized protein YhaN